LAAITCIQQEKEFLSSIAIVGGGPAGVELAGALAEFKKYIFRKDYPELQNIEMKVMLIEAKDRLLPDMPDKLSKKTLTYLKQLKVDVRANTSVKSYDGRVLTLDNGESLKAAAFIWTAGVKGTTINGLPEMAINRQSRVIVDEFSRVLPLDRVFAIGDVAQMTTKDYPEGHPMIAQPAIQQGKALADNIIRSIQEKQLMPFQYRDKGSLATVGMKKAVAIIFGRAFSGFIAWVIWSAVHLMSIIGVRNKLVIAVNWAWSYFTYDKGDRVIIHVNNK
jgi:NADH dehydrogenase